MLPNVVHQTKETLETSTWKGTKKQTVKHKTRNGNIYKNQTQKKSEIVCSPDGRADSSSSPVELLMVLRCRSHRCHQMWGNFFLLLLRSEITHTHTHNQNLPSNLVQLVLILIITLPPECPSNPFTKRYWSCWKLDYTCNWSMCLVLRV